MAGLFPADQYQLLDFGRGRRLERFGSLLLDRPCPTAENQPFADPSRWPMADARFDKGEGQTGQWTPAISAEWLVAAMGLRLVLRPTQFGHLGLFPEHAVHWPWLAKQVARRPGCRVLNLFAYTGAATLAAAQAGAAVTHVDSAKNIVAWARRNAEQSGLADASIRWIVEDASKFVRREAKRGNRYDAVLLDPPSYGHGAHGEVWRLSKHLEPLLRYCVELLTEQPLCLLVSCHTPGFDADRLQRMLVASLPGKPGCITGGSMQLTTVAGRTLPCGAFARYEQICS